MSDQEAAQERAPETVPKKGPVGRLVAGVGVAAALLLALSAFVNDVGGLAQATRKARFAACTSGFFCPQFCASSHEEIQRGDPCYSACAFYAADGDKDDSELSACLKQHAPDSQQAHVPPNAPSPSPQVGQAGAGANLPESAGPKQMYRATCSKQGLFDLLQPIMANCRSSQESSSGSWIVHLSYDPVRGMPRVHVSGTQAAAMCSHAIANQLERDPKRKGCRFDVTGGGYVSESP
jgi:hypothetical protein